jgi:hypothetical protein
MRLGALHVLLLLLCNVELLAQSAHGNLATTYQTLAKIKALQHDNVGAAKYEKLAATFAKAIPPPHFLPPRSGPKHPPHFLPPPSKAAPKPVWADEAPKQGFWEGLRSGLANVFALSTIFLAAVSAGWELYDVFRRCGKLNA